MYVTLTTLFLLEEYFFVNIFGNKLYTWMIITEKITKVTWFGKPTTMSYLVFQEILILKVAWNYPMPKAAPNQ